MPIAATPTDDGLYVGCGTDVPVGCTILYKYDSCDGCSYQVYDANGNCIGEYQVQPVDDSRTCGGGFTVNNAMSHVLFSDNTVLHKTMHLTAGELISDVDSLTELQQHLDYYGIDDQYEQDITNLYLGTNTSQGGNVSYPIGAIYLSSIPVDPSELFGGQWESIVDVFPASVYAYVRVDDTDITTPIVDMAVADEAICA